MISLQLRQFIEKLTFNIFLKNSLALSHVVTLVPIVYLLQSN